MTKRQTIRHAHLFKIEMIIPLFYRVTDDSTLLLTSTGTLTVYIQNVNDEDPVFSPSSYSDSVKEQTGGKHLNVLALKAPIATKVVCFSHLLKC